MKAIPRYDNGGADNAGPPGQSLTKCFVARQAILDRNQRVIAYELLFRSSELSNAFDGTDGTQATSRVIANSMLVIGLERILTGKKAFLNFTRDLLLSDYAGFLPPETTVIEVLESVEPTPEVVAACRRLKQKGYTLALDDFAPGNRPNPLTQLADIIKVDFLATNPAEQESLAREFLPQGIQLLAEKVETTVEFQRAREIGYTYFQGYFFARPTIVSGKQTPAVKIHYQNLLCTIHRPEFEFGEVEEVIRQDLSLAYKLLRYINSARFAWWGRIDSIRQALLLLGRDEIRKWVSLAILSSIGEGKPGELVMTAMIRAQFCELLGPLAGSAKDQEKLFVMGMFSVADAIMDKDMKDVLEEIHLDEEVCAALLGVAGEGSRLARIYALVRSYEAGQWDTALALVKLLGVPQDAIPPIYLESIQWSEQILHTKAGS